MNFDSPIISTFTIPSGATSGQRIVFDGVNGVILVYNAANVLVESVAFANGTDSTGQNYVAGFGSYDSTDHKHYSQLFNGALVLNIDNPPEVIGAIVQALMSQGPSADQPGLLLTSPSNDGVSAALELFGGNVAATEAPYARFGLNGAAVDMDVTIGGQLKYSPSSSLGAGPEMWHNILPVANWTNLGVPWGDPKFTRTAVGTVRLSGALVWSGVVTAAPVTVFTLPVGYRPNRQLHLTTYTMPVPAVTPQAQTIEITTAGVVSLTNYPAGGPITPITIEGLEFDLTT